MKTRPDSLIQLKSGRDSNWCFRIWQLFCHTSGSEHRHLKPDCACKLTNDSFGTSATHLLPQSFFFISLFSYFHALLQFTRAVHSLLLAKQGSVKRVTLVYLYHVNRWGTDNKLSIAKLDFVQVFGLSLNFYNNTLRRFYNFSDSRQTWTSLTLQSADWPISRQYYWPQMRKRMFYPKV